MLWNSLLLAVRAIRRNVLRSFLTILGVVIGVSAVIVMMTLGDGATQSVKDQISSLGSNLLHIRPGQRMGPGRETVRPPNFKLEDAEAIASQIGAVERVAPTASGSATVVYQAENWSTSLTGTTPDYFVSGNWTLASGRFFTEAEARAGAAVCVIGQTVRRELFGTRNPVGSEIRVKRFGCEVVGLLRA
jgi:putative ABC transport system permease protein